VLSPAGKRYGFSILNSDFKINKPIINQLFLSKPIPNNLFVTNKTYLDRINGIYETNKTVLNDRKISKKGKPFIKSLSNSLFYLFLSFIY
jgi:ribosomal protein S17E